MGVIMHNNISYGGGSTIEPNPQESATEQLETLGIDGDVYSVKDADAVHSADVGVANGVAELDANGKVPSAQLPSYVDDVLEYASRSAFPATGETGKIYVALDTNLTYRWSGSDYVEISPSLALGETSSTAYRGDRGKIAYDHSQSDHSGIKPAFTEASTRANIASGESFATILGKIKKFFSDLKTVAFTGAYSDLSGTPTLATVATSGSYNDLSNKPTIPTVNNGTLTIQKNGTQVATFTANQSGNSTANITVPDVSETDTTNTTPYLYRASQFSGDRCYLEKLVGASFGVNQLVENGNFADGANGWSAYSTSRATLSVSSGIATITLKQDISSSYYNSGIIPSTTYTWLLNHKYLVLFDIKTKASYASITAMGTEVGKQKAVTPNTWSKYFIILNGNGNSGGIIPCAYGGTLATNDTIQFKNVMLIDLTQMFGTSIADRSYTLEQTTAGSGIAWLKSYGFFTKDYYPYNAGQLISVNTSGKVNVGKNLWGNEKLANDIKSAYPSATLNTTNKTIYYTGEGINGIKISTTVYEPNTQYTFIMKLSNVTANAYANLNIYYTDGTLQTINKSGTAANTITTLVFTSAANKTIDYIAGTWGSGYTTLYYEHCGVFKGIVSDSDFEPYTTHTYPIESTDLRGVPKLVDNEIVYDGDVMDESGWIDRKYRQMDFGEVPTFGYISEVTNPYFYCNLLDLGCKESGGNAMAEGFANIGPMSAENFQTNAKNMDMAKDPSAPILYFRCTSYTTAAAFKTAFTEKKLQFSRATVLKEQTTPIENPEMYCKEGTEQFLTENNIPVGHESRYVQVPEWMTQGYYGDFRDRVDSLVYDKVWKLVGVFSHGQTPNIPKDCNELLLCAVSGDEAEYYGGEVFPYALYGSKFLVARPIDTNYVCELKPDGAVIAGGTYKLAVYYR